MADRIDRLEERIQVVEGKVDQLALAMNAGFQAVDDALREQREYTEFAFARLEQRLEARMDAGFAKMDARFAKMDDRFAKMDDRFAKMDDRFDKMDDRFSKMDDRLSKMDDRFGKMEVGLARVERKLDQFIDVQMRTNELVERRLGALE
jgi:chromosome segregation ATPase